MINRIKNLRKEKGLSQQEFGSRIGVSRSHIAAFENGNSDISSRVIRDIANVYEVNEEWLLTGEGEKYKPRTDDDELAILIGSLMAEDDEFKKRVIKAMLKLGDSEWRFVKNIVQKICE